MKDLLRLWLSRKLWAMLISVAVLWAVHERAMMLLYSYWMPEQISAFTTLTLATLTAIAAVVTAYMGIQGFAKSTLTTTLNAGIQAVSSRTGDDKLIKEMAEKFAGDASYRPLETL